MNKHSLPLVVTNLLAGLLFMLPGISNALLVNYLDSAYSSSFLLNPGFNSRAIEVDSSLNIYLEDRADDGSGMVNILRLAAVPLPPTLILLLSGLALIGTRFRCGKTY